MFRITFIAVLFHSFPLAALQADEHSWSLDSPRTSEIRVHGNVTTARGVEGNCAVLDGDSLLEVRDSGGLASRESGFTMTVWINPYELHGGQQMIAAKNRYSLGERQWGVMIDKDHRFRLHVWQGRWATIDCSTQPQLGHWHLIGVVIRPASAELWVNGKLAGQVKLTSAIPPTKAPLTFGGVDDNGHIWQNLVGALDEIRLFDRPLDAKRMAAFYKQVTASHKIPERPQPYKLWTGPTIPSDVKQIPFAESVV